MKSLQTYKKDDLSTFYYGINFWFKESNRFSGLSEKLPKLKEIIIYSKSSMHSISDNYVTTNVG